jgi:hypothetical protein
MKLHKVVLAVALVVGFGFSSGSAACQQSSSARRKTTNADSATSAAGSTASARHDPEKQKRPETMCPMHEAHMQAQAEKEARSANETVSDAHAQMNERGEKGMGFSQSATTHHFVLKPYGGTIQVEANNSADTANRDAIRQHLTHIAQAFSNGDFDIPMFVHATVPAGVREMKRLRAKIHYSYEETPRGGRVLIAASDKESLEAIHKFLRFQIAEHKTGDPIELR